MTKAPDSFVPLRLLARGPQSARATLAEIRQIYFKTTRHTIEHDVIHAIQLLKSLATEEEREKATVYMHGLAEMQKEWDQGKRHKAKGNEQQAKGKRNKAKGTRPKA